MTFVTDEFLKDVLLLVEYLEPEHKHFEEMEDNGEDTTNHIHRTADAVARYLFPLGFQESPQRKAYLEAWFASGGNDAACAAAAAAASGTNCLRHASGPQSWRTTNDH
jgi:hypothetical protein